MLTVDYSVDDETGTARLGRSLASQLPAGAVVTLAGPLGAGKTRLARAMAEACGVEPDDIHSPTFVILQEYRGHRPIRHGDLYRVADDDELAELGIEEWLTGEALTIVEWADRFPHAFPPSRLAVEITVHGETARGIRLSASGAALEAALRAVARDLQIDAQLR